MAVFDETACENLGDIAGTQYSYLHVVNSFECGVKDGELKAALSLEPEDAASVRLEAIVTPRAIGRNWPHPEALCATP
jgi:hypothetical protein